MNTEFSIKSGIIISECLEVDRSEFFSCLKHISSSTEFSAFLREIRGMYKNATHYCYAFITVADSVRSNDDGEPSGTAGKPIFDALSRYNLTDTALIIARYFGGKKLGAGGLTRAYRNAAELVLKKAKFENLICKIVNYKKFSSVIDYSEYEKSVGEIENSGGYIENTLFNEKITIDFFLPV